MAKGFSQWTGIGNLTRDPDVRQTAKGTAVAKFGIAANVGFGDNEKTLFMNCTVWGRQVTIVERYLKKGSKVMVTGELVPNEWQDREGNTRKDFETHISNIVLLTPKDSDSGNMGRESRSERSERRREEMPPDDEFQDDGDVPF